VSVSSAQRHTSSRPCPICGGHGNLPRGQGVRCTGYISEDGKYAHCSRSEYAGTLTVNLQSDTYAHYLSDKCDCKRGHSPQQIPAFMQQSQGEVTDKYDYQDKAGEVVYQVLRWKPKSFSQHRPDGQGGWIANMKGITPVLYHLPDILEADQDTWVFLVEGEKDVERLRSLGLTATCALGGAGKWLDHYSTFLANHKVAAIPDNDPDNPQKPHEAFVGQKHIVTACHSTLEFADKVVALTLPDLPPRGDVSDWLDAGGTAEELIALAEAAAPWTAESRLEDLLPKVAPPKESLAELLDSVMQFITRFVVVSNDQAIALTLWVAHAHAIAEAETTPYLSIRSAEMRSGKSRVLEVLDILVPMPLKTENISVAALAHLVNGGATLLLDEVDAIFGKGKASETQDMLRGILDSGYRQNGTYIRMRGQGADQEPKAFKTFGPKVLAGIGKLPGTLDDRSIIIELKRKARHEVVERFRYRDSKAAATPIAQLLSQWAQSIAGTLKDSRPILPEELDDRAADGWEPLLAIADLAGHDWPTQARDAALVLSAGESRIDNSLGVRLLSDIRALIANPLTDNIFTATLVESLNKKEESEWGGWNAGQGITGRELAAKLKPYGLGPTQVRVGEVTLKGYKGSPFIDVWDRYCPITSKLGETGETPKLPHSCDAEETSLPEQASVSSVPQIESSYDVSLVSPSSAGGGKREWT
jgi:hypothetical protein